MTHFVEWALGDSRSRAQQRVVTWWDDDARMLMAHNWFNIDFPGAPAFLACDCTVDSYTANRTEFIGRNGDPRDPAAMHRRTLGGSTGRFLDNCGALMRKVTLEPGADVSITFLLGQTETVEEAHALVARLPRAGSGSGRARRRARDVGRHPRHDPGVDARRGARPDAERPRRSTRRSHAASGAARPPTSPPVPSGSAISSRTAWRCSTSVRNSCATTSSKRRVTSSPRATCCTGGSRSPAAACARASPTTASGCRS